MTYNTGSPYRDYQVHEYAETSDRYLMEARLHERMSGFRIGNTEWFSVHPEDAIRFLRKLKKEEQRYADE